MRILHSIRSVDPRNGGPIEGLKLMADYHQREGREVEVVSLDGPGDEWVRQFPLRVHALGPVGTKYGFRPRLRSWLKRHGSSYDGVIVNGLWQFNSLAVWSALRGSGTPYFVFTHGMLDPWFKRAYPLKHVKKWLYWPWAEYRVLRDARAVFFTSEEERRLAQQSFWLYRCREVVVGYGTRRPAGDAAEQRARFLGVFPQCAGKRLFLFMARLHEKKGCDLALRAFADVAATDRSLHLLMAGPDQVGWQKKLVDLARSLGLSGRVTWPGMLKGDLKWGALRAAEVFVLPSHQENFGIAVAEALACEVPVLISNRVNIWREIEESGAGLVDSDTEEGTVRSYRRWMQLSESERLVMRQKAGLCFQERFAMEHVAERVISHMSSS